MKVKLYVEHVQGRSYIVDTEHPAFLREFVTAFGDQPDDAEELSADDVLDLLNETDQERSLQVLAAIGTLSTATSGEYVRATKAVEA